MILSSSEWFCEKSHEAFIGKAFRKCLNGVVSEIIKSSGTRNLWKEWCQISLKTVAPDISQRSGTRIVRKQLRQKSVNVAAREIFKRSGARHLAVVPEISERSGIRSRWKQLREKFWVVPEIVGSSGARNLWKEYPQKSLKSAAQVFWKDWRQNPSKAIGPEICESSGARNLWKEWCQKSVKAVVPETYERIIILSSDCESYRMRIESVAKGSYLDWIRPIKNLISAV